MAWERLIEAGNAYNRHSSQSIMPLFAEPVGRLPADLGEPDRPRNEQAAAHLCSKRLTKDGFLPSGRNSKQLAAVLEAF